MPAMEGEAGTQRVHVIESHHPPPLVHAVWYFPSGLYRGHSLHCNHPTLRSRVELFNGNHHAIAIHGPRKKSMIRMERVSAVHASASTPPLRERAKRVRHSQVCSIENREITFILEKWFPLKSEQGSFHIFFIQPSPPFIFAFL